MVVLIGNWWTFVLRGIVAILFGVLTFIMPGMALLTLVFLFGFYAIFDGVMSLIAAFRRNNTAAAPWWALLINGFLGLVAGGIAFFYPGITAIALLYLIAFWAIASGIMSTVAAVRLRKQIHGEWILVVSGVLSIIFGVLAAIFPGAGALAVVLWIGAFAVVYGAMLIALGVKLRSWVRRTVEDLGGPLPPGLATGH